MSVRTKCNENKCSRYFRGLNMILNEQLFRNYNELYESILRCYQENSVLEAYETLQKQQMDLYKRVCHISNLVVLLS